MPKKFRLIDLSQEFYVGMPVYPGMVRTQIFVWRPYEEQRVATDGTIGMKTMGLLLCDHAGTHVDAPSHFDDRPGAKAIDQCPLQDFFTSAICLDVSHIRFPMDIKKNDLEEACRKSNLKIQQGDTVLIYTGHYNRTHGTPDYLLKYPGLEREAVEWIGAMGGANIGIDAPSIDGSKAMVPPRRYPAHEVCRDRHLYNMENLANLDKVAGKGFWFIAFPLRIRGASGSPVRAVALLEK